VVITRHLIEDDAHNWRRWMRNQLEKFVIRRTVDRIITVSEATKRAYAEMINLPESRFETIFNGIELDQFAPVEDKRAARIVLALPTDGPLIAMVGVMRPGKGQGVAIDAMQELAGMHLLLVGDGKPPYRDELEARARDLGERVYFLGQRMDVPAILAASDLLVLPSDSEALPTVLIEAGASGLPVVATNVGGIPEIIKDGDNGLLIPPQNPAALAQAIRRIIDDPDLARAMGDRGYKRARDLFTLDTQADKTVSLYERVKNSP
jgi:glycosyltransferase involved in cell wall biosynthesis